MLTRNEPTATIPNVSVIIPFHRLDNYFYSAVDSALKNKGVNLDVVLVADVPMFPMVPLLESKYSLQHNLRIVKNNGKGIVSARNTGLHFARFEYVASLDSDDLAHENRFFLQARYLDAETECIAVGSAVHYICPHDTLLGIRRYSRRASSKSATRFPLLPKVAAPAVMFRRSAVLAAGGYRPNFEYSEDHDLWTRLSIHGTIHNLEGALTSYRIHAKQVSKVHSAEQFANAMKANVDRITHLPDAQNIFEPDRDAKSVIHLADLLGSRLNRRQKGPLKRVVGYFLVRRPGPKNNAALLRLATRFPLQTLAFLVAAVYDIGLSRARNPNFTVCPECSKTLGK